MTTENDGDGDSTQESYAEDDEDDGVATEHDGVMERCGGRSSDGVLCCVVCVCVSEWVSE